MRGVIFFASFLYLFIWNFKIVYLCYSSYCWELYIWCLYFAHGYWWWDYWDAYWLNIICKYHFSSIHFFFVLWLWKVKRLLGLKVKINQKKVFLYFVFIEDLHYYFHIWKSSHLLQSLLPSFGRKRPWLLNPARDSGDPADFLYGCEHSSCSLLGNLDVWDFCAFFPSHKVRPGAESCPFMFPKCSGLLIFFPFLQSQAGC